MSDAIMRRVPTLADIGQISLDVYELENLGPRLAQHCKNFRVVELETHFAGQSPCWETPGLDPGDWCEPCKRHTNTQQKRNNLRRKRRRWIARHLEAARAKR